MAFSEKDVKNLKALRRRPRGNRNRERRSKKIIQGSLDGFDRNTAGHRYWFADVEDSQHICRRLFNSGLSSWSFDAIWYGTKNLKRYQVTAVFEIGMSEYDSSIVFMPLLEAQKFFNRRNSVDAVEIVIDNADKVGEVIPADDENPGPDPQFFRLARSQQGVFYSALEVERSMMFIILSLIVLVAALNIISGLIMLVKDKSRDIAVLRTMGATRGSIMRIFFVTGASIGVVGTLAGFVLGVLFVRKY